MVIRGLRPEGDLVTEVETNVSVGLGATSARLVLAVIHVVLTDTTRLEAHRPVIGETRGDPA